MTITVEQPVTTATFTATIDPPREVQAGFVNHVCIEFSDYGKPVRDDDEQFSVSVRLRGKAKTPNGKPDKRTRSNGLLICFDWSELALALEVMAQTDHPMSEQTIRAIKARQERVKGTWLNPHD